LLSLVGVGPEIASTLLVTFGDNAERIPSKGALAKICGVAPLDASSGRQIRHRLNRGGNRQANRALHTLGRRPPARPRTDPRLHGAPNRRGQDQEGGLALPQALRRA